MKWKRFCSDLALFLVTSPLAVWIAIGAFLSKPRKTTTDLRIRWGLHKCSDGHEYDDGQIVAEQVLVGLDHESDKVVREHADRIAYDCQHCYKLIHRMENRNRSVIPAHEE